MKNFTLPTDPKLVHRLGYDKIDFMKPEPEKHEFINTGLLRFDEFYWIYDDGRGIQARDKLGLIPVDKRDQRFILITFYSNNPLTATIWHRVLPEWLIQFLSRFIKPQPKISVEVHLPGIVYPEGNFKRWIRKTFPGLLKPIPPISASIFRQGVIDLKREIVFKRRDVVFSDKDLAMRFGKSYLRTIDGNIRHIEIYLDLPDVDLTIYMVSDSRHGLPPHRSYIASDGNDVLDWKQVHPGADMEGSYTCRGHRIQISGMSYLDAVSGNKVTKWNSWLWDSFSAGPNMVLAGMNIDHAGGFIQSIIFGKDGKVIGQDASKLTMTRGEEWLDPVFKRFRMRSRCLIYRVREGDDEHQYIFHVVDAGNMRLDSLLRMAMIQDTNPKLVNDLIGWFADHTDPGQYLKYRLSGTMKHTVNGVLIEEYPIQNSVGEHFFPGNLHTPQVPPPSASCQ